MTVVLIIINILFTTVGQLLLKYAAIKNSKLFLASGYFLFVLVVVASYFLMKLLELKYFTVIMSLNYLTVFLLSAWMFKEELNKVKITGVFLIIIGIVIFSFGGQL
jgi:drug/metabolite transporter (DMT)-like permease